MTLQSDVRRPFPQVALGCGRLQHRRFGGDTRLRLPRPPDGTALDGGAAAGAALDSGAAEAAALTIGVLGPLDVAAGDRPIDLTTGRLRTLLAVLAMSAGMAVPLDRLTAAVWGGDLPDNSRRSLQTYVARLRGALGTATIGTNPVGYTLKVDPQHVDALHFLHLVDAAARMPDRRAERAALAQALALWRGAPFEGVTSTWLENAEAPRLQERYLLALERRIDLDIADGRCADLAAELSRLTALHPLRESLWARQLVVLERCGRRAEALARYEKARLSIAEELGVDPGPELRQIYAHLLT